MSTVGMTTVGMSGLWAQPLTCSASVAPDVGGFWMFLVSGAMDAADASFSSSTIWKTATKE